MQPKTAPTSPKFQVERQQAVQDVWKHGPIQQPMRWPWGRMALLILVLSVAMTMGVLYAGAWIQHRWPQSAVATWWPIGQETTVYQNIQSNGSDIPNRIRRAADSAFAIAVDRGDKAAYDSSDIIGTAWVLSSNGWLVTERSALPADRQQKLVVISNQSEVMAVTDIIDDTTSSFVFLQTGRLDVSPVEFASDPSSQTTRQSWSIAAQAKDRRVVPVPFSGQLSSSAGLSDATTSSYVIQPNPGSWPGAGIVDTNGRLVAIFGFDEHAWPITSIESTVKSVVQAGAVIHARVGLAGTQRATVAVTGNPSAAGIVVQDVLGKPGVAEGSPAAAAGVQAGDIITSINGVPALGDIYGAFARFRPGDKILLTIQRDGQEVSITVTAAAVSS